MCLSLPCGESMPGLLAALIQDSLATGVPISEAEWCEDTPYEFPPGGCILREENT